jgi:hypothetical protein
MGLAIGLMLRAQRALIPGMGGIPMNLSAERTFRPPFRHENH